MAHGWVRECARRLAKAVLIVLADALDPALAEANGDRPALGVREGDDRFREMLRGDARAFAVEPLVLALC